MLRSSKTAPTALPLSKQDSVFSTNSVSAQVVECPSLNTNCKVFTLVADRTKLRLKSTSSFYYWGTQK